MIEILARDSWLLIPLTALMIPIIAILSSNIGGYFQRRERQEARAMYERIVREKLDVIKTAVAMGRDEDEIDMLDERLERLIGRREMSKLLGKKQPGVPEASHEVDSMDIDTELTRIKRRPRRRERDA
ncbi:ABC transporter ATP-binding protein [bacterium]|nr:ABC transporter ATP-binding protein [bacterium]MCB1219592.1 ABC transporter ATP-binding protein [bacterium]UNM08812.1 MAG: ABC transporter ATP-binding protein [Planctomycetales bacterium]